MPLNCESKHSLHSFPHFLIFSLYKRFFHQHRYAVADQNAGTNQLPSPESSGIERFWRCLEGLSSSTGRLWRYLTGFGAFERLHGSTVLEGPGRFGQSQSLTGSGTFCTYLGGSGVEVPIGCHLAFWGYHLSLSIFSVPRELKV